MKQVLLLRLCESGVGVGALREGEGKGKEERMRDKNINFELKGVNNIFLIF